VDLSVIIVNWNSAELLADCLSSLEEWVTGITYEAFVVDNASDDADIRLCKEELEAKFAWVKFIYSKENLGFARANNLPLGMCSGDTVLLLNPDTCFVQTGLSQLLNTTNQTGVGMVGCKLLNANLTTQLSCFQFPLLSNVLATNLFLHKVLPGSLRRNVVYTPCDLEWRQRPDWVLGAFMLLPRKVLEQVGGFDESIFMYGEDMDLCFRVRQLGLEIVFIPEYALIHYGGCSGRKAWSNAEREVMIYKAIFFFYQKHLGKVQLVLAKGIYAIGALLKIAAYGLSCIIPGRSRRGLNEINTQWAVLLTQLNMH
jgi:N-acetylglucosaminyl-diphospho-decaprenol L-rhamnosyltransferase